MSKASEPSGRTGSGVGTGSHEVLFGSIDEVLMYSYSLDSYSGSPHNNYSTSSHVSYVLILLFMSLNYEFAGLELLKLPNTCECMNACREIERARLQL
jgi:hypothetical protein